MADLLKMICMIIIYILLFTMSGTIVNRLLGIRRIGGITVITGAFAWFAVQEIIYIPMLLMKAGLSAFIIEQIVFAIALTVVYMIFFRSKFVSVIRNIAKEIKETMGAPVVFLAVVLLVVLLLVGVRKEYSTDYAHTVSSIEMAATTGRMYMYDVDTGRLLSHPDYIQSLGVWNMNIAAWSSLLGVSSVKLVRYGMAWLSVILAAFINIRIGRQLFKGDAKKSFIFAGTVSAIMLVFAVGRTPAAMLFIYGGTAQAFSANVLMPFVFYWAMGSKGTYRKEFDLRIIPIIIIASLAVSAYSAIAVIFSMCAVGLTDMIIVLYKRIRGVEDNNADAA